MPLVGMAVDLACEAEACVPGNLTLTLGLTIPGLAQGREGEGGAAGWRRRRPGA